MNIESQLIKRSIDGDMDAFEELVLLYDKQIYNYCFRMTNNAEDAEDLAQEVFIKVYRSLGSFKSESKFSTWIYRIAHNTCIDNHRKKKFRLLSLSPREENDRQMKVPDREPLPEDQMVSREKYDLIKECIAELKPDYKSIIILRDIQNYTYQEIADILNIPLGTVKSNISRARALLRETLKSRLAGYDERRGK